MSGAGESAAWQVCSDAHSAYVTAWRAPVGRLGVVIRRTARSFVLAWVMAVVWAGGAAASPSSGPTAIVSLGDSFISGEAGRWQGNSLFAVGDRAGTDRAWTGTGYDPTRIYGASDANGCHRSDVSEIRGRHRRRRADQHRLLGRADREHLARVAGRPGLQDRGAAGRPARRDRARRRHVQARGALDRRQRPRLRRHHHRLRRRATRRDRPVTTTRRPRTSPPRCRPRWPASARRSTRSAP